MKLGKTLNNSGHVHLFLAAAIIVGIAAFGTYKLVVSHADSFSKNGIKVATVPTKPTTPVKTTTPTTQTTAAPAAAATTELNASNQKVAAPTKQKCADLGRVWSQNVCAWSSSTHVAPTNLCINSKASYVKSSPYDYCAVVPAPTH